MYILCWFWSLVLRSYSNYFGSDADRMGYQRQQVSQSCEYTWYQLDDNVTLVFLYFQQLWKDYSVAVSVHFFPSIFLYICKNYFECRDKHLYCLFLIIIESHSIAVKLYWNYWWCNLKSNKQPKKNCTDLSWAQALLILSVMETVIKGSVSAFRMLRGLKDFSQLL